MKKILLTFSLAALFYQNSNACAWYDPDYEYFNLFTQDIIKNKAYSPFLLAYSSPFYGDGNAVFKDENIVDWQKYFNNSLSYTEAYDLVYKMPIHELNLLKVGKSSHSLFQKLGAGFYAKYKDGIDYLIEAKYLEPYMKINYVESSDVFYYREETDDKNATQLNYDKTISVLENLYNATSNKNIKLRYAFQLVRFNHYNRKYQEAEMAFKHFVEPLQLKTPAYYLALNQLAGAQRGLDKHKEANWNFFQVFIHANTQKENAYTSMRLSDENSFQNLLNQAKTTDEKCMAYFLLGYQDFNNPLPMMEKIFELNPKSELLQVLAARAVNELERSFLPTYVSGKFDKSSAIIQPQNHTQPPTVKEEKPGFFARIWNFIKSLFSSKSKSNAQSQSQSTIEIDLNNPNRIPFFSQENDEYLSPEYRKQNYLAEFTKLVQKLKTNDQSEYWQITEAYLKFLNKEYTESSQILSNIKTNNQDYIAQINKMKMLNDVVAQPIIDADFEKHLFSAYKHEFIAKESPDAEYGYSFEKPNTSGFLSDVLANRYFLQGDFAKAYLMNNEISSFRSNPDLQLAKELEAFYNKANKNEFEKVVISKKMEGVGNLDAYFNLLYGDYAMKDANFKMAKDFYQKAKDFGGFSQDLKVYDDETQKLINPKNINELYNGFKNISGLVFGHNVWESFGSPVNESMISDNSAASFGFIKPVMNKLEIAEALMQLDKIGKGRDQKAAEANQLIGNLLYNTSALGYFREIFVMDVNNGNGEKYRFFDQQPFQYYVYYKSYGEKVYFKPDNFDLSLSYYNKALQITTDREQKARILFQMASAEQGKYYQYQEKNQLNVSYDDPKYDEKVKNFDDKMKSAKKQKFSNYFIQLKEQYADTKTSNALLGSCSYYSYFMKN